MPMGYLSLSSQGSPTYEIRFLSSPNPPIASQCTEITFKFTCIFHFYLQQNHVQHHGAVLTLITAQYLVLVLRNMQKRYLRLRNQLLFLIFLLFLGFLLFLLLFFLSLFSRFDCRQRWRGRRPGGGRAA